MRGNLPKRLTIIARPIETINVRWDDAEDGDEDLVTLQAAPAFICDPERPATVETARSWAKDGGSYVETNKPDGTVISGHQVYHGKVWVQSKKIEEFTIDNTIEFCKDIRITGLEIRSQGGRAYKVVLNYKGKCYYVDLREDNLLDMILNVGIKKGGIPECDCVWGKVGSQMNLIRVGSQVHTALVKATQLDEAKPIALKDLRVGDIFEDKNGKETIYLGKGTTLKFNTTKVDRSRWYSSHHHQPQFTNFEIIEGQIWYEFHGYDHITYKKAPIEKCFEIPIYSHNIVLKKKATTKNRKGNIKVPEDILEQVREAANKALTKHYEDAKRYTGGETINSPRIDTMQYFCQSLHFYPFKERPILHPFYSKFQKDYDGTKS